MTPLDNAIRQGLNIFDTWNNELGAIDPISSDYFQILQLIKLATVRGYNTKVKEVDDRMTTYEFVEWYLYSCSPHSDLDALQEWLTK